MQMNGMKRQKDMRIYEPRTTFSTYKVDGLFCKGGDFIWLKK